MCPFQCVCVCVSVRVCLCVISNIIIIIIIIIIYVVVVVRHFARPLAEGEGAAEVPRMQTSNQPRLQEAPLQIVSGLLSLSF